MKRNIKPSVDALETRALQTVGLVSAHKPAQVALMGGQALVQQASSSQLQTYVPGQSSSNAAPLLTGPGDPLPREVVRTQFHGGFRTTQNVIAPRYTGQKEIVYFAGSGSTNRFLHGTIQMAISMPADETQPITGAAYLQDKNLSGGNAFGLALTFDSNSLDAKGRPTTGTFVADPNIYSGSFYFFQAAGTLKIKYTGAYANVIFDGNLYTNGITNVIRLSGTHVPTP